MIELCRRQDDCFIEIDADYPFNVSTTNISLTFLNNFAGRSGTVIFGGSLDNCRLYLGGGFQDSCGNKIGREYTENPLPIILQIFNIDNMSSIVSSEPFRVCFCDHNGLPDCEMNVVIDTIRGKQFTLSAVTVGQGTLQYLHQLKQILAILLVLHLVSLKEFRIQGIHALMFLTDCLVLIVLLL